MTYGRAAVEIVDEDKVEKIWFGDPDVWHGVYERKNGHNNAHPVDQWYAVASALRRGKLFKISGYIDAPGFTTSREISHPVFCLK